MGEGGAGGVGEAFVQHDADAVHVGGPFAEHFGELFRFALREVGQFRGILAQVVEFPVALAPGFVRPVDLSVALLHHATVEHFQPEDVVRFVNGDVGRGECRCQGFSEQRKDLPSPEARARVFGSGQVEHGWQDVHHGDQGVGA